jgi:hypothetical protein
VPKPAFELTPKKLDPKLVAGEAKKPGNQAKANKVAAKPANLTTEEKARPTEKTVASDAARKRAARVVAMRRAAQRKKFLARSSKATAKTPNHAGGQKPSPAIAKTQASQEPSD